MKYLVIQSHGWSRDNYDTWMRVFCFPDDRPDCLISGMYIGRIVGKDQNKRPITIKEWSYTGDVAHWTRAMIVKDYIRYKQFILTEHEVIDFMGHIFPSFL